VNGRVMAFPVLLVLSSGCRLTAPQSCLRTEYANFTLGEAVANWPVEHWWHRWPGAP
jgi:hypothetical protein